MIREEASFEKRLHFGFWNITIYMQLRLSNLCTTPGRGGGKRQRLGTARTSHFPSLSPPGQALWVLHHLSLHLHKLLRSRRGILLARGTLHC